MDLKKYEYYRTELGVLYHADCLSIMPLLEPVDLVLTDPPYGMDKNFQNDDPETADKLVVSAKNLSIQLSENIMFFWSAQRLSKCYELLDPQRLLIWNKKFCRFSPNNVGYRFEPIAWIRCKKANKKRGDILNHFLIGFKSQTESVAHPTQKPITLFAEIINDFSEKSDTILDPFLGSGTTAVACERLNRRWIGIEIEEKYCEIAARRIEKENQQLKLFT